MIPLPRHHEPRGLQLLVHAALGLAAVGSVANFFLGLSELTAQKDYVARALFSKPGLMLAHPTPASTPHVVTNLTLDNSSPRPAAAPPAQPLPAAQPVAPRTPTHS